MLLNVSYENAVQRPSYRTSVVRDHFGIGQDQVRHTIAEGLELPVKTGDVVLFLGPSGSGKSSLMRAAAEQLAGVCRLNKLELGTRPLVELIPQPVESAMELLAKCGLGEANLLLSTPDELSDGQRERFRLALGWAQAPQWLMADEWAAVLDRTLARVISRNVRRQATRTGTGCLLATTHEDIVEDLQPDLLVRCQVNGSPDVVRPSSQKKSPDCWANSNLRPGRNETGRISHGGIIAATTSDWCGM